MRRIVRVGGCSHQESVVYRSREEVQGDLGAYEGLLAEIPHRAWGIFQEKHRDLRGQYGRPLVQPVLIHNYMEVVARESLKERDGFTMPPPGALLFYIDWNHKYVIKPRMLYSNYTVATNSTTLGFAFEDGSGQLPLPNMPEEVTALHLGYVPNQTKTSYASIHITCSARVGRNGWEWTLTAAAGGEQPIPFPDRPRPGDGGRLVKPRRPVQVEDQPTEERAADGKDAQRRD
jgi:hypothetical protein